MNGKISHPLLRIRRELDLSRITTKIIEILNIFEGNENYDVQNIKEKKKKNNTQHSIFRRLGKNANEKNLISKFRTWNFVNKLFF